ncbi:uncharacterized protein EI97DRAFT_431467 [Westerdykella ornata]|uniref:SPT2-domain-containing protein n=1 Tax=Westerdykella ornata TaxID=318751 RepID=A0A6A6JQM2_WESOR|nr:uncharacterized protein EI97DRAFT_431467 [Westerdykella ornata]KAF2278198.1 hypothetical protein EI97DRAFT_431467 [Westerdykella ornata]
MALQLLNNILSSIDPSASPAASAPLKSPNTTASRPPPRPSGPANGTSQPQTLKRKAEGQASAVPAKVIRNDGTPSIPRPNSANSVRPTPISDTAKPKTPVSTTSVPYRGPAGNGASAAARTPVTAIKKPGTSASDTASKQSTGPTKTGSVTSPTSTAPSSAKKTSGYLALLERAKEAQKSKPVTPLIKHEPTKILSKKERLALRAQALGKKPPAGVLGSQVRPGSTKTEAKDVRKSTEIAYQGTARPTKKPAEVLTYQGTARPSSVGPSSKAGLPSGKAKPKQSQGRYGGYASWSDEEEEEDIEEDGYSDESDMEGGIWDVEQEEQMALKAAKKEDAEALAEEMRMKREKEERKRKLMAMSRAAAARRKY